MDYSTDWWSIPDGTHELIIADLRDTDDQRGNLKRSSWFRLKHTSLLVLLVALTGPWKHGTETKRGCCSDEFKNFPNSSSMNAPYKQLDSRCTFNTNQHCTLKLWELKLKVLFCHFKTFWPVCVVFNEPSLDDESGSVRCRETCLCTVYLYIYVLFCYLYFARAEQLFEIFIEIAIPHFLNHRSRNMCWRWN